ncbi:hypothetical protein EVAR_9266_1 [Eumeta japonica]|uniref:Uncharacterized protein n=1 Tax=Eumeta variegata TaxID=151549 RepID=A0A4C1TLT7_EUMVA|nr:hypothetical protein EVAR_9266_1 [Eumeta japonica]
MSIKSHDLHSPAGRLLYCRISRVHCRGHISSTAYWKLVETLKPKGYESTPALKKLDNSVALDVRDKAECLADSIDSAVRSFD